MESTSRNESLKPWYESWFDSPYYDLLYGDRDELEAEDFLQRLLDYLDPLRGAKMLDLACGKGRYSRFLATKGFQVVGLDLSANSIAAARRYEHKGLSFYQHDMRNLFRVNYFDYIFNFFTSFGYFEKEEDNLDVLHNVHKGLKKNGVFVLDYFNPHYVKKNLVAHETRIIKGVRFELERRIEGDFVVKDIRIEDKARSGEFQERVRLFNKESLLTMFLKEAFSADKVFGDYRLSPYDELGSPRLIFILKKTKHNGDDHWVGRTDILLD